MSLFGSLFTGVSALNAQSQSMTIISNNIANSQTPGYKRTIASFANLVTGFDNESVLQPGGVRALSLATVDQQGLLAQTGSSTDLGILGDGMFVVGSNANDTIQFPFYTRAGQFQENEDGYLENPQGYVLYGWELDENGNIPTDFDNPDALEPINLNFLPGFNRATSEIDAAINLNSATAVSTSASPSADFTRVITVYDSLGQAQSLTVNMSKVMPPNLGGEAIFNLSGLTADTELNPSGTLITTAQTIDISIGGVAAPQISLNNITSLTVGELINQINAALPNSGPGAGVATLDDNGAIVIVPTEEGEVVDSVVTSAPGAGPPAEPSLFDQIDTNLAGGGALAAAQIAAAGPAAGTYDNTIASSGNGTFPALAGQSSSANPLGWWQVTISGGDAIGTNALSGFVNFNSDGTINHLPGADGNTSINISGIDFGNGSDPLTLDLNVDSFTQLNSSFLTTFVEQNGTSFGVRSGINIDEEGIVNITFSNGRVVPAFKIPLADFPNVNGLTQSSNNVYAASRDSGDVILREAGINGAGEVYSNSFEQSNVDLADEFSRLIITQRAYSAGTKVINTADQMLAELLNIR
jgi:flagellar hook protein FlgE